MTYDTEKVRAGREPITLVELDLDYCQLTYGQSPCMAQLGATGNKLCYNTRATCQDPANYDPAVKTYRFCTAQAGLPLGLSAIPSVKSVSLAPTKIEVEGGVGQRASVSIALQDHSFHDRGIDKYWRERFSVEAAALQATAGGDALQANTAGDALQARPASASSSASGEELGGTYWGRLRARNPYYQGRVCRIRTGYVGTSYDLANFITRTYLLENIAGPDAGGRVTIKAKDPLKLADDERAQAPRASNGSLLAAIDENDTAATLTPGGIGDTEYPGAGFLKIGREVVSFTRAGDALALVRAQFGTTSESHDADDTCQLCLRYAAQTVDVICNDLFTGYAGIISEYIPLADWQAEVATYLTRTYSTLITEPTGVNKLVAELGRSAGFSVFWDEREARIRLRALRAPDSDEILDDAANLLKGSITVTDKPELRFSQSWVFVNQLDPTEGLEQPRNYRQLIVQADLEAEGANKFGSPAIRKLFSRWITSRTVAEERALQLVHQFGESPRQISFSLDAKDSQWWTGDVVRLSTRLVQDDDGNPYVLAVQIIEASEVEAGHRFSYVGQAFNVIPPTPTGDVISIAVNTNDVNLLSLYTGLRGSPTSATVVTFIVEPGVIVGQNAATAALRTDAWPAGAAIMLEVSGRIQGKGGHGGGADLDSATGLISGVDGGTALLAESLIRVENYGEIWSGGGGGPAVRKKPAHGSTTYYNAGGGGAGSIAGPGGLSCKIRRGVRTLVGTNGEPGTATSGGVGGNTGVGTDGGPGGDPGLPGNSPGPLGAGNVYLPAGLAGYYVVNDALVTWVVSGDRRGRVG